jgi:hypothetical protein
VPFYIGTEEFEEALAKNKETFLQKTRQHLKSKIDEDFHDYMSWWTCFHEDKPSSFETGFPAPEPRRSVPETQENKQKKAKKKRPRRAS